MKKTLWWLLVPVALALAYVGSAVALGRLVVAKLAQQSAIAQRALPKGALEERVEHGLWRTTRTLTFHLGCAPGSSAPLTFHWRDEIHHGPFPQLAALAAARVDSRLELPQALTEHMQVEGPGAWALTAQTRVGFRGELESVIAAPAVKIAVGSSALDLSALDARVSGQLPFSAGELAYRASFAPLDLQQSSPDAAVHVTVGRLNMNGKLRYDPAQSGLFMPMQADGHVTHVLLRGSAKAAATGAPGDLALGLNDLSFTQIFERDKDLWTLRSSTRSTLDVLGFSADKLELAFALRRLHEPSLSKLARALLANTGRCGADVKAGALPADALAALAPLQADVVDLLAHDPQYAVGPIALELAGKRAALSYTLSTRGVTADDRTQPLAALVLSKGMLQADASLDLGLIDLIAQRVVGQPSLQPAAAQLPAAASNPAAAALVARTMIDGFVSQGYLSRAGDTVKAALSIAPGLVMLNGKPFELPDFSDDEP